MVELTVAIPTFNERDNVVPLLNAMEAALQGIDWEAVFVDDDSQDGTVQLLRDIGRTRPNVRLLQRIGRRGLASACTEGMLASSAPYLAVMDADLQHDPRLLPQMLAKLRSEPLDLVIGSRHVAGGDVGDFSSGRQRLSEFGARIGRLLMRADVRDPMSGFFMLRAEFLNETVRSLSNTGFKILVDLFLSAPRPVRFVELPYRFGTRHAGNSKLDMMVSLEYLKLLAEKSVGRIVPVRFVLFVLVGCLGVLTHLSVLGALHRVLGVNFDVAQVAATFTAMVGNYVVNNAFTYRDRRLHGAAFWWGLWAFCLACVVGAVMNNVIADLLYGRGIPWALAGVAGAFAGSVWNYATTATLVWQRRRPALAPAPAPLQPSLIDRSGPGR